MSVSSRGGAEDVSDASSSGVAFPPLSSALRIHHGGCLTESLSFKSAVILLTNTSVLADKHASVINSQSRVCVCVYDAADERV